LEPIAAAAPQPGHAAWRKAAAKSALLHHTSRCTPRAATHADYASRRGELRALHQPISSARARNTIRLGPRMPTRSADGLRGEQCGQGGCARRGYAVRSASAKRQGLKRADKAEAAQRWSAGLTAAHRQGALRLTGNCGSHAATCCTRARAGQQGRDCASSARLPRRARGVCRTAPRSS
jgi:hypothetical protein